MKECYLKGGAMKIFFPNRHWKKNRCFSVERSHLKTSTYSRLFLVVCGKLFEYWPKGCVKCQLSLVFLWLNSTCKVCEWLKLVYLRIQDLFSCCHDNLILSSFPNNFCHKYSKGEFSTENGKHSWVACEEALIISVSARAFDSRQSTRPDPRNLAIRLTRVL